MTKRLKYYYNKTLIYEWEQSLDEVNIYFFPPKWALKKYENQFKSENAQFRTPKIIVEIENKKLKIKIEGNDYFINEELSENCKADDSIWVIEDDKDELHIILEKSIKAKIWESVFKGHNKINYIENEEIKKEILKERFQRENPGFDFTDAKFNGDAPDAREFLGGLDYNRL